MRLVIAASQHRSLRRAAEALNIRQSTLSRRLRDLEHRLGAVLFERTNAGTRVTVAGAAFIEVARHIIADADAAFDQIRACGRGEKGQLALGVCMALSAGNLRATLVEHRLRHPDVKIRFTDGSRIRLLSDLATGSIDAVLMASGHATWTDRSLPLWSERIVVALPAGHRLCSRSVIHWADLMGETFLTTRRDPGPDYETVLLARLGGRHNFTIVAHKVSLERLLSLVGARLGLTLICEGATGAVYTGVTYRELHDDNGPVRINFEACWKETNHNPTLKPFLDLLRERYLDLSPPSASD